MTRQPRLGAAFGALIGLSLIGACGLGQGLQTPPERNHQTHQSAQGSQPQRIISLDYCADQYVMQLADRAQIGALSPDAAKSFSYLRAKAADLPRHLVRTETVLAAKPDLVVRSYGGGPGMTEALTRAGIRVVQIGYGEDYDGVRRNVRDIAVALGPPARGTALVADFDRRLRAVEARPGQVRGLYLAASGYTTGPGTLMHTMMESAGITSIVTRPGWSQLAREEMMHQQPDLVVRAHCGAADMAMQTWSPLRHPLAQAQVRGRAVFDLDGAAAACGGWFMIDAIEAMADARQARDQRP